MLYGTGRCPVPCPGKSVPLRYSYLKLQQMQKASPGPPRCAVPARTALQHQSHSLAVAHACPSRSHFPRVAVMVVRRSHSMGPPRHTTAARCHACLLHTTPPASCVVWRNSWITYNLVQVWAFGLDCFTTNYYLCAAPRPGANVPRAACNVEAAAQRAEHAQGTRRARAEFT